MNILIVTLFYYIEGRPDLIHNTNAVHYLVKYWAKEHNVMVFNVYTHSYRAIGRYISHDARKYYRDGYEFEKDQVKVHLTEVQKFPGQKGKYNTFQTAHIMKQFKQMARKMEKEPDIIIVHFPSYAVSFIEEVRSCFAKYIPTVAVMHKTDAEELENGRVTPDLFDKQYDAMFTRSLGVYKRVSHFHLKHLKPDLILSGIPIRSQKNQKIEERKDEFKIIYVGKLIQRKHPEIVIQAVADIPNICLDVIGEGVLEHKLKKMVAKLGVSERVHFLGTMSREEVLKKMEEAQMFCMPSVDETLGLTYLEAMSVGCVPIGTRDEGIDGVIVNRQNGFLVRKNSMQHDVEKYITEYMNMEDAEQKRIVDNAIETAVNMNEETCSMNYFELIKRSMN